MNSSKCKTRRTSWSFIKWCLYPLLYTWLWQLDSGKVSNQKIKVYKNVINKTCQFNNKILKLVAHFQWLQALRLQALHSFYRDLYDDLNKLCKQTHICTKVFPKYVNTWYVWQFLFNSDSCFSLLGYSQRESRNN